MPLAKCNSDISLSNGGERVGFGWVVSNSGSRFCAAKRRRLPPFISVLEAESLSIREALTWLKEVGYTHVVLEMDNITLYHA